jgi:hypothetical protein
MDKVKPLARQIIDAWPLAASGAPVRAVTRLERIGCATVGGMRELDRARLAGLRGIGDASLAAIDRFFARCGELESGGAGFPTLDALFKAFLSPAKLEVLVLRHGLTPAVDSPLPVPELTLQQVGSLRGITRERVRQIEAETLAVLDTLLVRAFLKPLYGHIEAILRRHGGAASSLDVRNGADPAFFRGYVPTRVLMLLGPRHQPPLSFIGVFTTLPPPLVADLTARTVAFLRHAGAPQTLDKVRDALRDWLMSASPYLEPAALPRVLNGLPGISATTDARYFMAGRGAQTLLRDILRRFGMPVHYRTVVNAYNAQMLPGSRKGVGTILNLLRTYPDILRTESGAYGLICSERSDLREKACSA